MITHHKLPIISNSKELAIKLHFQLLRLALQLAKEREPRGKPLPLSLLKSELKHFKQFVSLFEYRLLN